MKRYIVAAILIFLAFFLLAVPAVATDQTVIQGDYIEFNITAPGTSTIQFYVIGMNKFFVSDPEDPLRNGSEKFTKKELKEYLEWSQYYVYHDKNDNNGKFTIYLRIADDSSELNYFDLGEYQLIAQHPNADGIFNTYAEEAPGYGYSDGYNIITNGSFRFNIPAYQNLEAAKALVAAIADGNDLSVTYKFTVVASGSKSPKIVVVPAESEIEEVPVKTDTAKEEKTDTTDEKESVPQIPVEPVKTPVPVFGILAGLLCGFILLKRR